MVGSARKPETRAVRSPWVIGGWSLAPPLSIAGVAALVDFAWFANHLPLFVIAGVGMAIAISAILVEPDA